MTESGKWYVRNAAGRTFGPVHLGQLQAWVREGRVEPLSGVSTDLKNWTMAPLVEELEMNWIVENNPGQFYGPTHRAVVDDLAASGSLSDTARFYLDDRGAGRMREEELERAVGVAQAEGEEFRSACAHAQNELAAARGELDAVRNELDAARGELDAVRNELAATRDELAALRQVHDEQSAELASVREELSERERKDEDARRKEEEVRERRWETAAIDPEVISVDPPPATARGAFSASFAGMSLAALERQAQRELAKMGGAKKFFGLGTR